MDKIFHKEIAPGIFRLSETASGYSDTPGTATRNSYLVVGSEKAILFDLALKEKGLAAYAEKLAGVPIQVVFSHGHVDHVYHANKIKDAWLHPADFRLLQKGMLILPPVRPCPKLHPLNDGDVLDLGGRTMEVIHCPGHTDGGILLLDRQTQTLLTGDVISRRLLFNFPGTTDLGNFCKQLEALKEKDFTVIYTAHDRCGLPIEHLDLMLDAIQNQLPNATKTWLSPFGQKMWQCIVGKEDALHYFDICASK